MFKKREDMKYMNLPKPVKLTYSLNIGIDNGKDGLPKTLFVRGVLLLVSGTGSLPKTSQFTLKNGEIRKKPYYFPSYRLLLGILIMAYYDPFRTGQYNPLYGYIP